MTEAKISLTETELRELKEKWVHSQLWDDYGHLSKNIKDEIKEELLTGIRKKDVWNRNFYLTEEFKKELHKCLDEEVGKLVEAELIKLKKDLRFIVRQYLYEKIKAEAEDLISKFMIVMPEEDLHEEQES